MEEIKSSAFGSVKFEVLTGHLSQNAKEAVEETMWELKASVGAGGLLKLLCVLYAIFGEEKTKDMVREN